MNILHTFPNFPLSVCTQTTSEITSKEKLIEAYIVENEDGSIKFLPYINPLDIYISQHNNCVGDIWKKHNEEFTKLVLQYEGLNIVEIAGGSGLVFSLYSNSNPNFNSWKVIDINPSDLYNHPKVEKIKGLFEPSQIKENDVVISSHFVEHIFDLEEFLSGLKERNPKYHIFSLPNFKEFSKQNFPSTIMFEHPNYLPEEYLDYILHKNGWDIIDKIYYGDHSIFYITQPSKFEITPTIFNIKSDIINLIDFYKKRIEGIKNEKFYVFGAHFTYYYLINLGINVNQIIAVIDNDPYKQNKRMYGTTTRVISPNDVPKGSKVFVEMGPYNEEIKNKLTDVIFI
jgi:hypothetical protein